MLNDSRIDVSIGRTGSDETAPYHIGFNKPISVRDFVKAQLKDTREFGTIRVYDKTMDNSSLCYITYDRGNVTGGRIPDHYYNLTVKNAGGSGGWGRSDFNVIVKTDELFEKSSNTQEGINPYQKEQKAEEKMIVDGKEKTAGKTGKKKGCHC